MVRRDKRFVKCNGGFSMRSTAYPGPILMQAIPLCILCVTPYIYYIIASLSYMHAGVETVRHTYRPIGPPDRIILSLSPFITWKEVVYYIQYIGAQILLMYFLMHVWQHVIICSRSCLYNVMNIFQQGWKLNYYSNLINASHYGTIKNGSHYGPLWDYI